MPVLVWYAVLHRKDMGLGGGAFRVYFCQARVKLWTDLIDLILLRLSVPGPRVLTRQPTFTPHTALGVQQTYRSLKQTQIPHIQSTFMFS